MPKITYYCGEIPLTGGLRPVDNAAFKAMGGVPGEANKYDGFQRLAAFDADGVLRPVTRRIRYKDNPSLHKCGARCRTAKGGDCECECGGRNHGVG